MKGYIQIILLIVALCVGTLVGNAAIDYAFIERGYSALGGEMFVAPCAFICTYYLLDKLFKHIFRMENNC